MHALSLVLLEVQAEEVVDEEEEVDEIHHQVEILLILQLVKEQMDVLQLLQMEENFGLDQ